MQNFWLITFLLIITTTSSSYNCEHKHTFYDNEEEDGFTFIETAEQKSARKRTISSEASCHSNFSDHTDRENSPITTQDKKSMNASQEIVVLLSCNPVQLPEQKIEKPSLKKPAYGPIVDSRKNRSMKTNFIEKTGIILSDRLYRIFGDPYQDRAQQEIIKKHLNAKKTDK